MADWPIGMKGPETVIIEEMCPGTNMSTVRGQRSYNGQRSTNTKITLAINDVTKTDIILIQWLYHLLAESGSAWFNMDIPNGNPTDGYQNIEARFTTPLNYSYEGVIANMGVDLEAFNRPVASLSEVNTALGY